MGDDGAVRGAESRPGDRALDPGLEAKQVMGEGQFRAGTKPVDELGRGVEAAHTEDLVELSQGVEVLGARSACGQGTARRELIDTEPGPQVVKQEAHFGLGPHSDDSDAQRLIAVGVTDPLELMGQIRSLKVV